MKSIRIGTRGSQLALWQAHELSRLLREAGVKPEIVIIKTTGDRRQDVPLASIGGKGLFIKELEEALLSRHVDLAVHSLKDVPSIIPGEFLLAGFLERADPRDVWIRHDGASLDTLPEGALIGTSSPRRQAQILSRWPHLRVEGVRGNVETRIARQREGSFDAVVLASAGLTRLGWLDQVAGFFGVEEMVPAAGQGIIGLEVLKGRDEVIEIVRRINHLPSETAALTERGILQQFETRLDCYSPIAVHAGVSDGRIDVRAFISELDGSGAIRVERSGAAPEELISEVAVLLRDAGALDILARTTS
jgi:hydroxymethylbilane synthase